MCWSLIVPWLFKLCSISASDILMIGLWVQLNVPFDFQLPVDAQHSPPPLPLFYCSCYLSDSSSWLCPSPLLHPGLEKTAALLSPLSYNLFLPFPCCLRCFFFSSCPTVVGFVPVISLFDLLTCDVISGFWPKECWDWTSANQHQPPACAWDVTTWPFFIGMDYISKNYINGKTSYDVLFSLAVSLHIYMDKLMFFMPWKKSLRVLKILRS